MQLDGSPFYWDVVLNNFNMAYADEDSIIDQKYENRIFWYLYLKILFFMLIEENEYLKKYSTKQ